MVFQPTFNQMYQSQSTSAGEASTTRPVGALSTRTNYAVSQPNAHFVSVPPISNAEYNAFRHRLLSRPEAVPVPVLSAPVPFLGPLSPPVFPRNSTKSKTSSSTSCKKKKKSREELLYEERAAQRSTLRKLQREEKFDRQHSQMLSGLARLVASRTVPELEPLLDIDEDVANSSSPPPSSGGETPISGSLYSNAKAALKTAADLPVLFDSFKDWFATQKDIVLTDVNALKDSAFQRLDGSLGSFATALTKGGAILVALSTFIYCSLRCCQEYSKSHAIAATLALCFLAYLTGTFQYVIDKISALMTWYKSWKDGKQRSQSGFDTVGKIIATVLSYWSVKSAPDAKKISEVSKALAGWDRAARGASELLTFVLDCVRPLIEKVRSWCNYDAIVADLVGVQKVDAWIQRCTVSLNSFNESKIRTVDTLRLFRGLAAEGYALLSAHYPRDEQHHVLTVTRAWITRLEKCVGICEAAGLEAGPRQVPLCIYISGPPGVGKSAAILYIAVRLLMHINRNSRPVLEAIKKNYMSFLHSRESWNEFWDGINVFVQGIIFNDPAQNPDPSQDPFYMELLKVIDLWPLHVHMSAIEDKGNTFIAPKFIIIATNEDVPPSNALKHTEALNRRLHVRVKAHVNLEFAKANTTCVDMFDLRLDPDTLLPYADQTGGIPFVKEVTGFIPMDEEGQRSGNVSYSLDGLLKICCDRYDSLEKNYASYMKSNNAEFERLITERLQAVPPPALEPAPEVAYQPTLDPKIAETKGKEHADVQPDLPKQTAQMRPVSSAPLAYPKVAEAKTVKFEDHGSLLIGKDSLSNNVWATLADQPHLGLPVGPSGAQNITDYLQGRPPLPEIPNVARDPYHIPSTLTSVVKEFKLGESWKDVARLNRQEAPEVPRDIATRALFFAVLRAHPSWRASVVLAVAAELQRWYDDAVLSGDVEAFLQQVSTSDLTPLLSNVKVVFPDDISLWWKKAYQALHTWYVAFTSSEWFQTFTLTLQSLSIAGVIWLACWFVLSLLNRLFFKRKKKPQSQSDPKTPQQQPVRKVPVRPQDSQSDPKLPKATTRVIARVPQKSQIGGDNTVEAIAERALKSNIYLIKGTEGEKLISFTVFKGHVCWINTHFVANIKNLVSEQILKATDSVLATHVLTGLNYELRVDDILDSAPMGNDHSAFYWNNAQVPLAKNLVPYVLTEEDHRRYASGICHMLLQVPQHKDTTTTIRTQVVEARRHENVTVEDPNGEYTVPAAYHYSCQTVGGDCGSII